MVAIDVQGYLRKVEGEQVVAVDYKDKLEALPYITVLKANEKEMEVLTGCTDPHVAARLLADWGCKEVILTLGDRGSLIYAGGQFYEIPAIEPEALVDAKGCGDYIHGRIFLQTQPRSRLSRSRYFRIGNVLDKTRLQRSVQRH